MIACLMVAPSPYLNDDLHPIIASGAKSLTPYQGSWDKGLRNSDYTLSILEMAGGCFRAPRIWS